MARQLFLAVLTAIVVGLVAAGTAAAVRGAVFTTTNPAVDNGGTGNPVLCLNGGGKANTEPANNCNIYTDKNFVWLSGGPASASLGAGTYFFAVLVPGGQADPNDGAAKNLSDDFDIYTNRTFAVDGSGNITYLGTHDFSNGEIRLMPYADTTNPGGVHIMAVCSLANGYPVAARDCKYDAFKVKSSGVGTPPPTAEPPSVVKDAAGTFDRTFTWGISKSVDKTLVEQTGGTATFTYTVTVTHDSGTDSHWTVSGNITVFNPNANQDGSTVPVTGVTVTDSVDDLNATCTVTGGANVTLSDASQTFSYTCTYSAAPAGSTETNTAEVQWLSQPLTIDGQSVTLDAGSDTFAVDFKFSPNLIDDCAAISDTYAGSLGTVCSTDPSPKTFKYSRTVNVPQFNCVFDDNTATFTTNTTSKTGSSSQKVEVCGPANTGALSMGYWKNPGQAIISGGASTTKVCNSGAWLRQYYPFQDLSATATCSQVATYVSNVINAANASGSSMNKMLKAQMLATALDVYFSDPALGSNKIKAGAPIGGVKIDLTMICKTIGSSGGSATCGGAYENVSSVFGGASSLTVSQMLAYAASKSNAGGSTWYGNVKATQQLAKDAFDAINNQVVFSP